MGIIRSGSALRYLRQASQVAAQVMDEVLDAIAPGVSAATLEAIANGALSKHRATAPFKAYEGFGYAICVSVNEGVVNGPPTDSLVVQEGDVVSVALAAEVRTMMGKLARTVIAGNTTPPEEVTRLIQGTQQALDNAIDNIASPPPSGTHHTLKTMLQGIPDGATAYNLTIIENTSGAGIGKHHMDMPLTPNNPDLLEEDSPLLPGMAFTLMPMITLGNGTSHTAEDQWTVVTSDGALAAHMAETVWINESGCGEVLTRVLEPSVQG